MAAEEQVAVVGKCLFCGKTLDSMEQVDGEPAGWQDIHQTLCLGTKCMSQRAAAGKIAGRKLERDRRAAVQPVKQRFNAERQRRRERKAKRKGIAAGRNDRGLV